MGCNFVLTIVLARSLSPSHYGLYFVVLNTVVILVNVGTLGLDRVVVRFASKRIVEQDPHGLRDLMAACLGTVAIAAGIISLLFWLLGGYFFADLLRTPGLFAYMAVISLWLFSSTLQGLLTESFRGLNDIRLASLFGGLQSNGILTAVSVCSLAAAFAFGGNLTLPILFWISFSTSASIVVIALVLLFIRLRREGAGSARPDGPRSSNAGEAIREGWAYWFTAIIVTLRLQGGAWLASRLDSADHVALYAVAQRMMILLVAPTIISNAVLPPVVAQLHSSQQLQKLERVVRSICGVVLLPSMALMAVLVIGGKPILAGLFGAYYVQAYPLLAILCIGQTFNIATGSWQVVLPMTGNQRHMLLTGLIAMVVLLSLALTLGHWYGVTGVAIAIATSIVITNLTGMMFVHRTLGIWTYASVDLAMLRDAKDLVAAKLFGRKPATQRS
jgi:O-antigen/teichoic acid export membrane protein